MSNVLGDDKKHSVLLSMRYALFSEAS